MAQSGFTVTCNHCEKEVSNAISKQRFDEVYNERKEFKAQLEDLQKSGKSADVIAKQLEAAQGEITALKSKHEVDLAMVDLGIKDPDVREALEWQYGKLPTEGRAPFTDTVKAWHTEPDKAPAVVRSLLPKPKTQEQTATQQNATTAQGAQQQTQQRAGFGRHTTGLEGTGGTAPFQPGSLRAKIAAGTLTQADLDAAAAAISGKPLPQQKTS